MDPELTLEGFPVLVQGSQGTSEDRATQNRHEGEHGARPRSRSPQPTAWRGEPGRHLEADLRRPDLKAARKQESGARAIQEMFIGSRYRPTGEAASSSGRQVPSTTIERNASHAKKLADGAEEVVDRAEKQSNIKTRRTGRPAGAWRIVRNSRANGEIM